MKNLLTILLFALAIQSNTFAQSCPPQTKEKIMLIGDSWAQFMWDLYRSYDATFEQFGFSDVEENGAQTALIEKTAAYFAESQQLQLVRTRLGELPDLEIVIIVLGGNDMLNSNGGWHVSMTPSEEQEVLDRVKGDLREVIDNVLNERPDVEILLAGYDYMNFVETIQNYPPILGENPYKDDWIDLGSPTPIQANEGLSRMGRMKADLAGEYSNVSYVNTYGVMQYTFGYSTALPIPPGGTFPPESVPLPGQAPNYIPMAGGDVNYPSPPIAMNLGGLDCIHLGEIGYEAYTAFQMQHFLFEALRQHPEASFQSRGGAHDGWVATDGTVGTDEILAGSNSDGGMYKGIISFDTDGIPANEPIQRMSLFINRHALFGMNPFDSLAPKIDIKSGTFGTTGMQASDYDEAADASDVGCFVGFAPEDEHTVRIDLDPAAFQHLNRNGITEFRIYFEGNPTGGDDYLVFHNGNQPRWFEPPLLDVDYGFATSVNHQLPQIHVSIYPNPAKDQLHITGETQGNAQITLRNLLGQSLKTQQLQHGKWELNWDVSTLKEGMYIVELSSEAGIKSDKVIVE